LHRAHAGARFATGLSGRANPRDSSADSATPALTIVSSNHEDTTMRTEPKIGDKVRSFDFAEPGTTWGRGLLGEDERASYVEGTIVDIVDGPDGVERYQIECDLRVAGNRVREQDFGRMYFPPVNGTPTLGGYFTAFVDVIEEAK